jgi:hypothetical protein
MKGKSLRRKETGPLSLVFCLRPYPHFSLAMAQNSSGVLSEERGASVEGVLFNCFWIERDKRFRRALFQRKNERSHWRQHTMLNIKSETSNFHNPESEPYKKYLKGYL